MRISKPKFKLKYSAVKIKSSYNIIYFICRYLISYMGKKYYGYGLKLKRKKIDAKHKPNRHRTTIRHNNEIVFTH